MEDSKIVQMYLERDERAISVTAEKYGKYCEYIAKNILGSGEDAEECVNDTYLSAWNSIPPHRPEILSVFLGKITRNLSFNRYKYNKTKKRNCGEITMALDELAEIISGNDDVDSELNYKELVFAINEFLNTLDTERHDIFIFRYFYTESISDIAHRYGKREGNVSMTLNRIRKKLQRYLYERGFKI